LQVAEAAASANADAESMEVPAPRPFFLSPSGLLPFDASGWDREVTRFLGRLDTLFAESSADGVAVWGRLGPWCVGALAAAVALELGRRKGTRRPSGTSFPDSFLWINHGCRSD
jgi:hypothetical protein